MKRVLVTGSNGLLGQQVVQALLSEGYYVTGIGTSKESKNQHDLFRYISADLTNSSAVESIFKENEFSHVVHLAAIAHMVKGLKVSWSKYYRVNTMMSRQIFECASEKNIPIYFASTVDVYGIQSRVINEHTQPKPIGSYAKSKLLAEKFLVDISKQPYLIARFSPVYTDNDYRDIHRRYYIFYPKLCFLIGNGMEYEFLSSKNASLSVLGWIKSPETMMGITNVCDPISHNTKELIQSDRQIGLAHNMIKIPSWLKKITYLSVNILFHKLPFLKFQAYKIICPMKFEKVKHGK